MDTAVAAPATLTGGRLRGTRDRAVELVFAAAAVVCLSTLAGIFLVLVEHGWSAFTMVDGIAQSTLTPEQRALFSPEELAALPVDPPPPPALVGDFLADARWNPTGDPPRWGILAMVVSTLLVTVASVALSAPIGVATAAWLAFGASARAREVVKPLVEVLAAVPSVVLGFVGIVFVAPALADTFGLDSGLTALNGAILLAVMSLPTIVSLSEDALVAVPREYVEASLALGADRWQTLVRVVIPAARSGVVAAMMLGMGRAIGETMTVLMACGNAVAMPHGLFDAVRTLTATVAIELGETPQDSRHFHMLFAVGLALFVLTLAVNVVADVLLHRRSDR